MHETFNKERKKNVYILFLRLFFIWRINSSVKFIYIFLFNTKISEISNHFASYTKISVNSISLLFIFIFIQDFQSGCEIMSREDERKGEE